MCQMYMYMYNKTGNLSNLGGINLNIILNVIYQNLGTTNFG
jgi:hypothetical protein